MPATKLLKWSMLLTITDPWLEKWSNSWYIDFLSKVNVNESGGGLFGRVVALNTKIHVYIPVTNTIELFCAVPNSKQFIPLNQRDNNSKCWQEE